MLSVSFLALGAPTPLEPLHALVAQGGERAGDFSWNVLQLAPNECLPPGCEPGERCTEFGEVPSTDSMEYSNLGGMGPDFDRPPGIRVNTVGINQDGVAFDYVLKVAPDSDYPVKNTANNILKAGGGGELLLQTNLRTDAEVRAPAPPRPTPTPPLPSSPTPHRPGRRRLSWSFSSTGRTRRSTSTASRCGSPTWTCTTTVNPT